MSFQMVKYSYVDLRHLYFFGFLYDLRSFQRTLIIDCQMKKLGSLIKLIVPHLKKSPSSPVLIERFDNPIVDISCGGAFALALDSNT
jgi:hypothetical protein